MEVQNKSQCTSPTPQTSSPNEHDNSGIDNKSGSVSLTMIKTDPLTFIENGQNQSNYAVGEDQMTEMVDNSDDNNIETVNQKKDADPLTFIDNGQNQSNDVVGEEQMTEMDDNSDHKNIETDNQIKDADPLTFIENGQNQSNDVVGENQMTEMVDSSDHKNIETVNQINEEEVVKSEETQENKRKRSRMNDEQINIMENALLDQPDLRKTPGSLQLWADKLSRHGSEVTCNQLKNWLNNRKAKLARAAAKEARAQSDPVSDPPEGPIAENHDPSPPTVSHGTHEDSVVDPTYDFKHGQNVSLKNNQGEVTGTGSIHLSRGVWLGWNLEELKLCVVDVDDVNLPKWTPLPHPTIAGSTYTQAQSILGRMRILWDSSQLSLIQ